MRLSVLTFCLWIETRQKYPCLLFEEFKFRRPFGRCLGLESLDQRNGFVEMIAGGFLVAGSRAAHGQKEQVKRLAGWRLQR